MVWVLGPGGKVSGLWPCYLWDETSLIPHFVFSGRGLTTDYHQLGNDDVAMRRWRERVIRGTLTGLHGVSVLMRFWSDTADPLHGNPLT